MARQRDPRRDEAFEIWKSTNGEKPLKDIAAELDCSPSQIRKWKSQDNWEGNSNVTNEKRSVTKESVPIEPLPKEPIIQSDELTDKQQLFCLYYVKSFNSTQSAIKAGYSPTSAHVEGSRLLKNAKVAAEIRRIKEDMHQELFISATDVLQKYVKIAFADVTDYVSFGKTDIVVDRDEDDKPIMQSINYVDFNESSMVDGTIITEVKQGKDGVSVKLADKMKALEKLELYFDLLPDHHKRRMEEEKLKLAQMKLEGDKGNETEKDVASALRGLVSGINSKAN